MTTAEPPRASRDDALSSNGQPSGGAAAAEHTVQFYESREFLHYAAASYIADGLTNGQPVIVFATDALREALAVRLTSTGIDVDGACRSGRLTLESAREVLAEFMAGLMPDERQFDATVARRVERSLDGRTDTTVRAYGELADVLWRDGKRAAALRVEELWNELADRLPLSLLCTYAMGHFYGEAHTRQFREICGRHGRVVPAESHSPASGAEDRGREVSLLQQRARSLEAEVEHRKRLEAALRDAKEEAEEANRAKSDFLAVMSHELRTPLNAIVGYGDLLAEGVGGSISAEQRSYLGRIGSAARQLLRLINQILSLSRIEAGEHEIRTAPVDVAVLVSDTCALVAPGAAEKELAIEVDAPERSIVCDTDADKLRQILLNLLSNAVKFTDEGGIALHVSTREGCVQFEVRDTGVGIPPAQLDRIFDPFARGDVSGVDRAGGTGLGLPVSRELARLIGGSLSAASTPGKGSVFTLRIPLRPEKG